MKPIAPDVWQLEGAPMRMPGGVYMPLASAVLRLADRTLLVYSPIRLDGAQAAAIEAEGEVAHIVAPNLFHHLHVQAASERWPRATVHAPPGLAAKRGDLHLHRELASGALDPGVPEVEVEIVGGAPKLNEALLFHRPSGTLVCADLLFNITQPANLRTRFALSIMGVGGRTLMQSRLWRTLVKDRAALRASIDRVLGWPIAVVLPAHGDAVTIDAAHLAPKLSRSYGRHVAVPPPG